jgi:hypothetical protein
VRADLELSDASVSFDGTDSVPNAGTLPAAVLAQRIDLGGLIDASTDGHTRDARAQRVSEGCWKSSPSEVERCPRTGLDIASASAPGRIRTCAPASGGQCSIP